MRRCAAALAMPVAFGAAASAVARQPAAHVTGPPVPPALSDVRSVLASDNSPQVQMLEEPRSSPLMRSWEVGANTFIAVGRFSVIEPPRPRTHTERERSPTSVLPRERGIAAVGLSLRF
jgi:hypothetical protein